MQKAHLLIPLFLPSFKVFHEVLVQTNLEFLARSRRGEGVYKDTGKRDPEVEIQRIADGRGDKYGKFRRIHERFPLRSLPGQCAYLLRSFSGLQVFPDANHRSSFYFLRSLLWRRGIVIARAATDAAEIVRRLKNSKDPCYTGGLARDELLLKDASYLMLESWFGNHLRWKSFRQGFRYRFLRSTDPLEIWDWSEEAVAPSQAA